MSDLFKTAQHEAEKHEEEVESITLKFPERLKIKSYVFVAVTQQWSAPF